MKHAIAFPRVASLLAASLLAACSSPAAPRAAAQDAPPRPAPVPVEVEIDFGPLGKPAVRGAVELAPGSDAVDAARALLPVVQDWLCCSAEDVWSIGGVDPDPRLDRYWFWRLDGEPGRTAAAAHRVSPGQRIRWSYAGIGLDPAGVDGSERPRVVSLLPAATAIVDAVGAARDLVGVSHLCRVPEGIPPPARVLDTPIRSDEWDMARIDAEVHRLSAAGEALYRLDEESIAALRPDLVISQGLCPVCAATPEELGPGLERAGAGQARLLVLTPRSLADVARDIAAVGEAVGRTGAGRVAARLFERRIEAVRIAARTAGAGAPRPRVAVIEWFEPLWISGEWIAEMVEAAGGEPVLARPGEGSRRVTLEELAAADPEVLVLAPCSMPIARGRRELALLERLPGWSELPAVRAGRVFLMDGEAHFSSAGPGLAEGCEALRLVLAEAAAPARSRPAPAHPRYLRLAASGAP